MMRKVCVLVFVSFEVTLICNFAEVAPETIPITKPVFYGACSYDTLCPASGGKRATQQLCLNALVVDFETDHWITLGAPDKLNQELLKWFKMVEENETGHLDVELATIDNVRRM